MRAVACDFLDVADALSAQSVTVGHSAGEGRAVLGRRLTDDASSPTHLFLTCVYATLSVRRRIAIRTYPMPAGYSGVEVCTRSVIFPVRASAALACSGTS